MLKRDKNVNTRYSKSQYNPKDFADSILRLNAPFKRCAPLERCHAISCGVVSPAESRLGFNSNSDLFSSVDIKISILG